MKQNIVFKYYYVFILCDINVFIMLYYKKHVFFYNPYIVILLSHLVDMNIINFNLSLGLYYSITYILNVH